MSVKVILQQDVPSIGHAGDVKQVAAGYFRNFLQPRGLAVEASNANVSELNSNKKVRESQAARAKEGADAMARHLQSVTLRIPVKLGEQGRIYGSVTNKDIAEALQQQASMPIDRHRIELKEPLKTIGMHTVPVKLEHGIDGTIRVELVPEGESATT